MKVSIINLYIEHSVVKNQMGLNFQQNPLLFTKFIQFLEIQTQTNKGVNEMVV